MNLSGVLEALEQVRPYGELLAQLEAGERLPSLGLSRGAQHALLAKLALTCDKPLLLLTGRVDAVPIWQQALEGWLPEECELLRFPEPTPLPYDRGPWSESSRLGRLRVLTRLMAGQHPLLPEKGGPLLLLASARSALQKTLPRQRFLSSMRVLKAGSLLDLDELHDEWREIGYEQVAVVEALGQFSQRGGIIDLYPAASPYPVRIELFGDEVGIDTLFRSRYPALRRHRRESGATAPGAARARSIAGAPDGPGQLPGGGCPAESGRFAGVAG
jgi:transcription-repair coupling factor (superfamily II helicase)